MALPDPVGPDPVGPDPVGPELVGLVPAAGHGERLGALPGSKELLTIGFAIGPAGPVPRVACQHLLSSLRAGGVERAFVVLRPGKWDLPAFLAGGGEGPRLAYLVRPGSRSLPESLDAAYPFVRGGYVALGFPDVLFAPDDAFATLRARLGATGADLVLGLFPAPRPHTTDMVELAGERVVRLELRPAKTELRRAWLIAVWGPAFTELLHAFVAEAQGAPAREPQLGEVIQRAVDAGLDVRGVELPGARYRDLGTPEEVAAVWREGWP
jgi:glucose-1-phosphate thymidylyltransferase